MRTRLARGEGVSLTSLPSCSANGMVCASDIWFSSEDVGESWASASQSNVVGMAPGLVRVRVRVRVRARVQASLSQRRVSWRNRRM